jgi:hypothetical protein
MSSLTTNEERESLVWTTQCRRGRYVQSSTRWWWMWKQRSMIEDFYYNNTVPLVVPFTEDKKKKRIRKKLCVSTAWKVEPLLSCTICACHCLGLDKLYSEPIDGLLEPTRRKLYALFMARWNVFHAPVHSACFVMAQFFTTSVCRKSASTTL